MEQKRFTKNDSGFVCANCGFEVKPLKRTSRNHCPRCLCSLHVDILPGDRACDCGGVMKPIFAEPDPKKGYVITHKCTKCGFIGKNRAALSDGRSESELEQYDDTDFLIRLTVSGGESAAATGEAPGQYSRAKFR